MNDKIIIGIIVAATLGIVGIAVLQQQKRLPELEARRPPAPVTPPPGLDEGKASPLEFAKLFENLKPVVQRVECPYVCSGSACASKDFIMRKLRRDFLWGVEENC